LRNGRPSLLMRTAARYGIEEKNMLDTLKATAFRQRGRNGGPPPEITNEQMVALLIVAERYDLDPFVKQIYAFPNKAGGIEPIVPIDGWIKIIQNHPQFQDWEIIYPPPEESEKNYAWVEVVIWRKDRKKPTRHIEWFTECYVNTDPWNAKPRRMLEWKTIIQCGRKAFGLSGISDPDEGERIIDVTSEKPGQKPATEPPRPIASGQPALINEEQLKLLREKLSDAEVPECDACGEFKLEQLEALTFDQVPDFLAWVEKKGR